MSRPLRIAKAGLILVGLIGAVAAWFAPVERWPAPPRTVVRTPADEATPPSLDLDSALRVAVAGNPFRADRMPAEFRWGQVPAPAEPVTVFGPSPEVRVHGILHGGTPMAILSIGEDRSHTLVRVGAETRGVTLRSVSARSVELAWGDSIWSVPVAGGPT